MEPSRRLQSQQSRSLNTVGTEKGTLEQKLEGDECHGGATWRETSRRAKRGSNIYSIIISALKPRGDQDTGHE